MITGMRNEGSDPTEGRASLRDKGCAPSAHVASGVKRGGRPLGQVSRQIKWVDSNRIEETSGRGRLNNRHRVAPSARLLPMNNYRSPESLGRARAIGPHSLPASR